MKNFRYVFIILSLIFLVNCGQKTSSKGHLFIVGGGHRPQYMVEQIVELAGGKNARVMIIPNASGIPREVAQYQQKQFQNTRAASANYILFDSSEANSPDILKKIDDINCIFFSGGDQRRLARDLNNSKLLEKIREIYQHGGVISGTSAGAAVMSKIMITGDELIDTTDEQKFNNIKKDYIKTTPGFGFLKKAIIDQHFVKRKRFNRLLSLVIEQRTIGIGIDESTAIHINPANKCKVIGENTVLFINGTDIRNVQADEKGNLSAENIKLDILQSGQIYDLKVN